MQFYKRTQPPAAYALLHLHPNSGQYELPPVSSHLRRAEAVVGYVLWGRGLLLLLLV